MTQQLAAHEFDHLLHENGQTSNGNAALKTTRRVVVPGQKVRQVQHTSAIPGMSSPSAMYQDEASSQQQRRPDGPVESLGDEFATEDDLFEAAEVAGARTMAQFQQQ
ncbi:MAG: hypothetical protein AAGJ35_10630, partial [Myxococcota bacterium]